MFLKSVVVKFSCLHQANVQKTWYYYGTMSKNDDINSIFQKFLMLAAFLLKVLRYFDFSMCKQDVQASYYQLFSSLCIIR